MLIPQQNKSQSLLPSPKKKKKSRNETIKLVRLEFFVYFHLNLNRTSVSDLKKYIDLFLFKEQLMTMALCN